jgi:hypothetical protein
MARQVTNFMVGAMDEELLKILVDDNIPTFAMQSNMTTHDFGWGTKNFHLMGRKKIALIRDFTIMGFDILVSDVDTVCEPSWGERYTSQASRLKSRAQTVHTALPQ